MLPCILGSFVGEFSAICPFVVLAGFFVVGLVATVLVVDLPLLGLCSWLLALLVDPFVAFVSASFLCETAKKSMRGLLGGPCMAAALGSASVGAGFVSVGGVAFAGGAFGVSVRCALNFWAPALLSAFAAAAAFLLPRRRKPTLLSSRVVLTPPRSFLS